MGSCGSVVRPIVLAQFAYSLEAAIVSGELKGERSSRIATYIQVCTHRGETMSQSMVNRWVLQKFTSQALLTRSIRDAPRGCCGPVFELFSSPGRGFVFMARGAGVRNSRQFRFLGSDEAEGVGGDVVVLDGLLDVGHMAGDAFAARAALGVVGVFTDGAAQAGGILPVMTGEAHRIALGVQVRLVLITVNVVAVEAAQVPMIHIALNEVIALHAIFVGGAVGVLIKVGGTGFQLFKLPVVGEPIAGEETDRPVVIAAGDGILEGASLGVALHADIVAAHEVQLFGIDDVGLGGVSGVETAGAMAFFAAHVPFGDLVGFDVVADGVATIAGGAGGTVEVGWAVVGNPPVCTCLDMVGKPSLFGDVPLRRKREIIIAALGEISLLVAAAVNEGNLVQVEVANRRWMGKVSQHCFRMCLRIANDVGHARRLPPIKDCLVAFCADFGTSIGSLGCVLWFRRCGRCERERTKSGDDEGEHKIASNRKVDPARVPHLREISHTLALTEVDHTGRVHSIKPRNL
jgi:hypothetical protein